MATNKAAHKMYLQKPGQDIGTAEVRYQFNASQVLKISDFWAGNAKQDVKKIVLSSKFKTMPGMLQSTAKSSLDLYQEAIVLAKQIIIEINNQNK